MNYIQGSLWREGEKKIMYNGKLISMYKCTCTDPSVTSRFTSLDRYMTLLLWLIANLWFQSWTLHLKSKIYTFCCLSLNKGGRDGCELLNQACLIPSLPVVSNDTDTGGSNRADREDHITHVTEDGLVLACGGEAGDGTDDLSCVQLDVAGKGFQVIHYPCLWLCYYYNSGALIGHWFLLFFVF